MPRLKKKARLLLEKSRESAILAVTVYNNPGTTFRSSGFIVLMNIAWTSLFHAIFERDRISYFYKDPKDRRRYLRIDGEFKAWELSKCAREYFNGANGPVYQNIQFFIGIRNKIEHRFVPQIDPMIFGECQSFLINYEEILVKEFGEKCALADTLLFALQYSRLRSEEQLKAVRKIQSRHFKTAKDYIDNFRRNLDPSILSNPSYALRVFLVPKPAISETSADAAIEFVKYDPTNPKEMERYEHLVALIKEKTAPTNPVSIVRDPLQARERVFLVDRKETGTGQVIGITRDLSKSSGILVVEKFSEDIFDDVSNIADAAMILHNRFKEEFPFSERVLYFVYAGRQNVTPNEAASLFLKGSYNIYGPLCYWIIKTDPKEAANFIKKALDELLYPKVLALMKIIIATKNDYFLKYVNHIAEIYKSHAQKPMWYWSWASMLDKKGNSDFYAAIGMHHKQELFHHNTAEIIDNFELGDQVLSKACADYATKGIGDKSSIRQLDLIVHLKRLSNTLPTLEPYINHSTSS